MTVEEQQAGCKYKDMCRIWMRKHHQPPAASTRSVVLTVFVAKSTNWTALAIFVRTAERKFSVGERLVFEKGEPSNTLALSMETLNVGGRSKVWMQAAG